MIALPADGISSAAGGPNVADVAFAFRISGVSLAIAMALAVVLGIAGGVLPAFSCLSADDYLSVTREIRPARSTAADRSY